MSRLACRHAAILLAPLAAVLLACPPDPGAGSCQSSADCPAGTRCEQGTGLCRTLDAAVADGARADSSRADAASPPDALVVDTAPLADAAVATDAALLDQSVADTASADSAAPPDADDVDPDATSLPDAAAAADASGEDLGPCGHCPEERPVCSAVFGCVQCLDEGTCSGRPCNSTTHTCQVPADAG